MKVLLKPKIDVAQYRKKSGRLGSLSSWFLAIVLASGVFFYGPGLLILKPNQPKARASSLSFICASSAAATSTAACTGEAAGDLLLVMAGETSGGAAPSLATGFTSITTLTNTTGNSSTQTGMRVGWNTAANSSTGSGTWTSATDVVMMVYRGQSSSPIGTNFGTESGSNAATSVIYNSDALSVTDGSSWFAAFAIRNGTADTHLGTAPTGMTNRTKVPTTPSAVGHDLNGPTASNWTSQTVSSFSASLKYTSIVLEIKAAPVITASATGTATASMTIPSTSNYTGGAFAFVRDIGTVNITSIKITDIGTVNASSNISNLILFYKQQASCSTSIPSGTTQFNSTGGSFVSEASTVTGTMSVGASQICVYAQVDVGSGASSGDTLDLEIANPSTDVVAASGSVTPSSAVTPTGSTTLALPGPTNDQVLRGGEWFSGGSKQSFYWAN